MKVRLTDEFVKGLEFSGKEQRFADETQTGFYVRLTSDSKTFVAQASVDGKTKGPKSIGRYEDGMPVAEARRLAALQIAAWRTNANVQMPTPGAATLRVAFDAYLANNIGVKGGKKVTRKESTNDNYRYMMDKPLSFITRQMVDAQHSSVGDTSGHATANLWVRYLRAIYKRFDKTNQQLNLPKNPCEGIDFFPLAPRDKVIQWDGLRTLWDAIESCSPIRRDCWQMLLLSGLRSNACSQLKWKEIDFENGTLTVPAVRMKAGKDFTLPLSRYVVDMLMQRKADNAKDFGGDDCGFVFPTTDKTGNVRAIRDIQEQGYDAEGNKIRLLPGPQVLRRTFNSACLDPRVNIPEHHRFFLMNHALPGRNVNEKHYSGMMRGLEPYRESLEKVTAEILKAVGVEYATTDATPDERDAKIAKLEAELARALKANERLERIEALLAKDKPAA
jgi:integrase